MHLYHKLNKDIRWNCIFQQDKYSSDYWLEICPKNVTKAAAINKLKKVYYCDKVVVFEEKTFYANRKINTAKIHIE